MHRPPATTASFRIRDSSAARGRSTRFEGNTEHSARRHKLVWPSSHARVHTTGSVGRSVQGLDMEDLFMKDLTASLRALQGVRYAVVHGELALPIEQPPGQVDPGVRAGHVAGSRLALHRVQVRSTYRVEG